MSQLRNSVFFRDFLDSGSWTATEGDIRRDRHAMGRVVDRCADAIRRASIERTQTDRIPGKLHVFCVTNAMEAMTAYFVASKLSLFACVVPLNRACEVLQRLHTSVVKLVVLPRGRRIPSDCPCFYRLSFDFLADEDLATCPSETTKPSGSGAQLLFGTSGSTGFPKFVVCEETRLVANAAKVVQYLGLSRSDRTLCSFPVTLMYGFSTLLCTLLSDGHIEFLPWRTPALMVETVASQELNVVPIIGDWAIELVRIWRNYPRPLPKVKVLNASDRILKIQAEHILSISERFWNNYGQTEAGPRILAVEISRRDRLDDLCYEGVVAPGRAIDPSIELEIRKRKDSPTSTGNLYYSTPFGMKGYLEPDGRVVEAPTWQDSGDIFRRTSEGIYQWVGRAAHSIKYNGSYIMIHKVLDRLLANECVAAAAFQKSECGDLLLFVHSRSHREIVERHVQGVIAREAFRDKLRITVMRSFPRTESGKIDSERLLTRESTGSS